MKKTVNRSKAENAVRDLLSAFNIAIKPGMEETPARVVRMLDEVWEGERYSNSDIATMYGKTFETTDNDIVIVKDIEAFSYCEHHLALIYNMKISIGYIPNGKIIGLSKIARIADMCCKRLQVQERIGTDIAEVMQMVVGDDVVVRIEASHSCMTARGIKKPSSKTVSFARRGKFVSEETFRDFLEALKMA